MSDVIHWQTLTPEQRNELIADKIFDVFTVRFQYQEDAPYAVHHRKRCGGDEPVEAIPRYSESLDAAWLIVRRMIDGFDDDNEDMCFERHSQFINAIESLIRSCARSCTVDDLFIALTPEIICIAALQACGCEVQR